MPNKLATTTAAIVATMIVALTGSLSTYDLFASWAKCIFFASVKFPASWAFVKVACYDLKFIALKLKLG